MQDLLASTVEDYEEDRILNLDDSSSTNFAVYTDDIIIIEPREGANTVASADDANAAYVIENADEQITGLKEGDIFAYSYGENDILIVKVASITLDGTTATVTGGELEIEEVFSHMKVESTGDASDIAVDENSGDEGITYTGLVSGEAAPALLSDPYGIAPAAEEGEFSEEAALGFVLEKESGSVTVRGSLNLTASLEFSYYISMTRQFMEFKNGMSIELALEVSGEADFPLLSMPCFGISPVPGVYIGFEPELVLKFSAKVAFTATVGFTIGFSYLSGDGVDNLSTAPKINFDLDVEGSIFFGIDLCPKVTILGGWVADVSLSSLVGVELKAEMTGTLYEDTTVLGSETQERSIHACESCLDVHISAKAEFALNLSFLKIKALEFSYELAAGSYDIGTCYYSFDLGKFGWGGCPNKTHRVTVHVKDAEGNPASGIAVTAAQAGDPETTDLGTTNEKGVLVAYLAAGTYGITAAVDENNLGKEVTVTEACKVVLDKDSMYTGPAFLFGKVDSSLLKDYGTVLASGSCSPYGYEESVFWRLYSSGVLQIYGQGAMRDSNYSESNDPSGFQKNLRPGTAQRSPIPMWSLRKGSPISAKPRLDTLMCRASLSPRASLPSARVRLP